MSFKEYLKELTWQISPSDYFHLPVVGEIKVKPTLSQFGTDITTYEVIDIAEKFYVVNQWYKEYKKIPQLIPKDFVIEFKKV